MALDGHVPGGPLAEKWDRHRFDLKLVNPANKRRHNVIVVGTGLAGASAASTLSELGYHVKSFCLQDSPRRAHSIAAQGGINAAKNYQNDGDSVFRLFYDTIKGGDYRAREANVYRLAQISTHIIDQCVAQGVPFAREYGGVLANRSFGGAQVSRTFYARGQTGQQLLLGAYGALMRQVEAGKVRLFPRHEMLDVVVVDGMQGGTAATQEVFIEHVGIPTLAAIPEAVRALQELDMHRKVQLVVSGGIRSGADVAKALALGADAVSIGTAALVALGDNDPALEDEYQKMGTTAGAYDDWHEGNDPAGITTQRPELARRLDPIKAGRRLANYLTVMTMELQTLARANGKSNVLNLEPEDLVALTVEAAAMARVPLAGTSWIPGT